MKSDFSIKSEKEALGDPQIIRSGYKAQFKTSSKSDFKIKHKFLNYSESLLTEIFKN